MQDELSYVVAILALLLLLGVLPALPVGAFIYPDGTVDNKYESFGPHADQLEFLMFAGETPMWVALTMGQIDLTDWPLTAGWRSAFSTDPNIVVVGAGGDAGFSTIDFNYNPNARMGNPPGAPPNRANPVYIVGASFTPPYPMDIPPISNNVHFRRGVAHLFNRAAFNAFLVSAGIPMLTPVPVFMGGFVWPGATGFAFDTTLAEQEFQLGHILLNTAVPPSRFYDYNQDGVEQPAETKAAEIIFTWRTDTYNNWVGVNLCAALAGMGFSVPLGPGLGGPRTGAQNYLQVMLDKNYHMTTLGLNNIGPAPDFLYDLYHINNYWDDPGSECPNTAALNDSVLNSEAEGIKFAQDVVDATNHAWTFQQRFEAICAQIPLYCSSDFKAHRKWYSGGNAETLVNPDDGENIYRRKPDETKREWLGVADQTAFGDNGWFSLLNMYPNCTPYGNNQRMTIRYGWSEIGYPKHINPFYSDSYWDDIVLRAMYDSLGSRDPYNLAVWKGDLVKTWSVGTWNDFSAAPPNNIKSKVTITLRPDVRFTDGTPMTIADVIFSLVGAGPLLIAEGYAPPWWWPIGSLVKSYNMIDAYTVEILYDVQSLWAADWTLGGFLIVPEKIWEPIITTGNPSQFAPDPNFIASGPWRYKSMVPQNALTMVANTPGSVVDTDQPGHAPITSPGYHAYCPVHVNVHADGFKSKIILTDPNDKWSWVNFTVTSENLWSNNGNGGSLNVNKYVYLDSNLLPSFPVGRTLVRQPDGTIVPDIELLQFNLTVGRCNMTVAEQITGPAYIDPNHANPWLGQWINVTLYVYVTWDGDITGRTLYDDMGLPSYPYKSEVPTPDFKVDMQDVSRCSAAWGSIPGDPRWDSVADINKDYRVDSLDLNLILKYFTGFPDIAVTNLTSAKTVICQGYCGNLTVTVQNQGNFTETFNVTVYANTTSIASKNVTLSSGNSTAINFTWDTSGFVKGNYTIKAVAAPVPGETDTADNNCTDGLVVVAMVGDVNADGKVEGKDLGAIAWSFGSYPGAPPPTSWDPNCDIDNDGKIDGKDLGVVSWHFGEWDP
jgi:hypothetical protein